MGQQRTQLRHVIWLAPNFQQQQLTANVLATSLFVSPLQLQEFSGKQQQLELQYRPVVQQLPSLLEQLRPEELSQAAEFAALEGMREPLLQVGLLCWQECHLASSNYLCPFWCSSRVS